ncbi:hypothetical protein N7481_006855 [Penicillium waksmanii]|uniref:uncharacterized protein n=1 Tax=Penicillium waksmanii TaxID=69791 RepID=UPI0025498AE4|nr:uncharacterized protein N7481_006855 [Penicillium waksmanii]KAJ5979557.1 hypothetical protein N7481_006855 [Penicillium waksmanii]
MNASKTRHRTERGARSKNGCQTCISKKVKCDEQRPHCRRCIRLQLQCEWTTQPPSLSARRRGFGPIKSRESWAPRTIQPRARDQLEHIVSDEPSQVEETSDSVIEPPNPGPGHFPEVMFNTWPTSTEAVDNPINQINTGVTFVPDIQMPITPQFPLPVLTLPNFFAPSTLFTSDIEIRSPSSLGESDFRAVSFHRAVFAPLKSTQKPASSAHFLFLDLGIRNSMILDFILAVSHNELSIRLGSSQQPPPESWIHFQHGSQKLTLAINSSLHSDHVGSMLSMLYIYMFWLRVLPLNYQKLRGLSLFVCSYVKSFDLDGLCASSSSLLDTTLLSRILTYLYDRDGFCAFFGCGGAFASYVSQNQEKRKTIWQLSRSVFTSSRGLPTSFTMSGTSDPPDSHILTLYFELISIHHDINRYSQAVEAQTVHWLRRIKRNLAQAQEDFIFVWSLLADCKMNQRVPPLMALVAVTFFHAIQIYLFRSRDSYFGQLPISSEIQRTLNELIATAYQTVAAGPVQLLERFQWSLLIAGVETHDPVHLDWIFGILSDPILKAILKHVKRRQAIYPVSMDEIRKVVDTMNHEHP